MHLLHHIKKPEIVVHCLRSRQVILIVSWARYEPLTKGSYTYPEWANAIGWIIAMTAILAVPVVAVAQILMKLFVEYKDLDFSEVK